MGLVDLNSPARRMLGKTGKEEKDLVYYELNGRMISRVKGQVLDPQSEAQQLVRGAVTEVNNAFAGLSPAQREDWQRLAGLFRREDKLGRDYALNAQQAFLAVNVQRVLAGQGVALAAPPFSERCAPDAIEQVQLLSEGQLCLTLRHALAAGQGYWRLRLTAPLSTLSRQAYKYEYRPACPELRDGYVPIETSPQRITLPTRHSYAVGQTLGVEVLALSQDFIPGTTLVARRLIIS